MLYKVLDTEEEVDELILEIIKHQGVIGADTETTGLDWMLDKILLLQLHLGEQTYIVDVRKVGYSILERIIRYLEVGKNTLIFHNAKFDMKFIQFATGILLTHIYDTQTAEVVLNAGKGESFYSLVTLVEKYTDYFMDKESRNDFINFPDDKPFTERMLQYSALDVIVLPLIYQEQMKQLEETHQTYVINVENELTPVVAQMEIDGIRLDAPAWLEVERSAVQLRDRMTGELKEMIADFAMTLKAENGLRLAEKLSIPVTGKARRKSLEEVTDTSFMRQWFVENFNPKSWQQMLSVINLMGIPAKNTNEKTIQEYAGEPVIDQLLLIRGVNKQIDAYGKNVVELIHPVTGKIHTEYFTTGTRTGRFSSKNPNMQNVPTHGGYRECFIPDEEFVFAAVDYSQEEYRLAGAISKEPRIIEAYQNGSDMHTATAQILYGKQEVTKDERSRGKTVNFAILYGSTEFGLHHNLKISIPEAKEIIDNFWNGYPQLQKFMESAGRLILEKGYSITPIGRRRYNLPKPTYMSMKQFDKWQARVLREGKNCIIQGGGADVIKLAMIEISKRNPFGRNFRLLLQIHDELVAMVHDSVKHEAIKFMKETMEEVEQRFLGSIPAKADDVLKTRWSK